MAVIQSIVCIPKTFSKLAMQVLNVLLNYGLNSTRIDFVGDRYQAVSIKNAVPPKRVKGGILSIAIIMHPKHAQNSGKNFCQMVIIKRS